LLARQVFLLASKELTIGGQDKKAKYKVIKSLRAGRPFTFLTIDRREEKKADRWCTKGKLTVLSRWSFLPKRI